MNNANNLYREKFNKKPVKAIAKNRKPLILMVLGILAVGITFIFWLRIPSEDQLEFTDHFDKVSDDAMAKNGWFVKNKDTKYWGQRTAAPGQLTLYTLKGDNWPDAANKQSIKNLVLRAIPYDCFTAEVHLSYFVPKQEWQQAGILLLEDTTLTGKSVMLSIAFNDFFGGYQKPKEILVQAVASTGDGLSNPGETAHKPTTYTGNIKQNPLQLKMLQNSALRIEKHGKKLRLLYAGGVMENAAFKEVLSQELDIQPKYIGIFALKGFKDSTAIIPAHFTFFRIAANGCQ